MATHSRVLAWRVPGMAEPGRLPSMGSHRVGHDWSDVAAAAAVAESRKQTCIMGWLRGRNNWCKISETRSAPHRSSPLSLSFRIYRTSSSSTSGCRASYDRLPQNHGTMITQRRAKIKSVSLKQSLPFIAYFFFFKCAFFAIVNQSADFNMKEYYSRGKGGGKKKLGLWV